MRIATDAWLRTTPLAVFFFLGRTVKGLVSNFANIAASAAGLVILVKQHVLLAVMAVVLVLAVVVVVAFLRYWYFQFRVEEDGILFRQGVLKKTQLDIRFDRIQGVSTEQSLIYRRLGLVAVRLNTAGAAGDEGYLPAVTPEFVARLRERIDERGQTAEPTAETPGARKVLLRLDGGEVLRIGLTDARVLQFALVGTALTPAFGKAFEDALDTAAGVARESLVFLSDVGLLVASAIVLGTFAGIVAVFVIGSIVVALLRFHGYELSQEGGTLRSTAGLMTRKDVSVEVGKVQQMTVVQGLLMRGFGCFRVQAIPAIGGESLEHAADGAQKLTVPLVGDRTLEDLRERIFGREGRDIRLSPLDDRFAAVSPYAIWPPVLWAGLVPGLVGALLLGALFGKVGLWCLVWVVPVALVAWQRWRRCGYLHDDDALVCRSGFLGYRMKAFLFRKVQQVGVSQSPLQRRKRLAALHIHLATGSVSVPFIDAVAARQLRDYILFKTETSEVPWF